MLKVRRDVSFNGIAIYHVSTRITMRNIRSPDQMASLEVVISAVIRRARFFMEKNSRSSCSQRICEKGVLALLLTSASAATGRAHRLPIAVALDDKFFKVKYIVTPRLSLRSLL